MKAWEQDNEVLTYMCPVSFGIQIIESGFESDNWWLEWWASAQHSSCIPTPTQIIIVWEIIVHHRMS